MVVSFFAGTWSFCIFEPLASCQGQFGFEAGVYRCIQFGCDRFFLKILCVEMQKHKVGSHWHETVRLTRYMMKLFVSKSKEKS